jgi:hypothetical protein
MTEVKRMRVGTDALHTVLRGVADAAYLASQLSGGFSFQELASLIQLGQDVTAILSDAGKIVPEYTDLTDDERTELVAWVSFNVKVPASATAEIYLKKLLNAAIALSALFN